MPVLKGTADPCSQKYDCVWLLLPEMRQVYGLLRQMLGPEAQGCEHPPQALELKSLILGFPIWERNIVMSISQDWWKHKMGKGFTTLK